MKLYKLKSEHTYILKVEDEYYESTSRIRYKQNDWDKIRRHFVEVSDDEKLIKKLNKVLELGFRL